jgi:protoporphyrin/coproporphyrin ferrochelatase
MNSKTAIVLLQLGGPDSLDAVEPFLYNLFCDPDIINFPGSFLFRKWLARTISRTRAPKVQELYNTIGGRSPILPQTVMQAEALKRSLSASGIDMDVQIAMRYWRPFTEQVIKKLMENGTEEVILLPLYPHYSIATTGSSVNEWNRVAKKLKATYITTKLVKEYYNHPLYIDSLVERVNQAIERVNPDARETIQLVFSAHGTPMKLVRNGDPYSHQIRETYELVTKRGNFGLPHLLCFQSKVGPQKWLEPSLVKTVEELSQKKVSHIIVNPIAFVSDHIETLSEISIEARDQAIGHGVQYFAMTDALLVSDKFIGCLTDLVLKELKK